MKLKRYPEIACPVCGKIFHAKKGMRRSRGRTLEQWKWALTIHLMFAYRSGHRMKAEKADEIVESYIARLSKE